MDMDVPDDGLYSAYKSYPETGVLQNGFYQIGGSGLALGACDPDYFQLLCGMAEPGGRDKSHGIPGVRHLDDGYVTFFRQLHGPGDKQSLCPLFHCFRRKSMSVKFGTFDADEEAVFRQLSGIVDDCGYFYVGSPP